MDLQPDDRIYLILGEMRGDIKSLLHTTIDTKVIQKDHAERISKLERGKAFLIGGAAAIGAVVSPVVNYIMKHV